MNEIGLFSALQLVVTFVSIVSASCISLYVVKKADERNTAKEKFSVFYVPYIKTVYMGATMADFSSYVGSKQTEFVTFLIDKIQFASPNVQKQIFQLYRQFSSFDPSLAEVADVDTPAQCERMDKTWREINHKVYQEYGKLCAQLGYHNLLKVHL